ncbi:replicase [Rubus virus 1]|uniref:Replicase n=2 Tax=Rubus virus 1 TaxID=2754817 RepID=A0AAE7G5G6_9VIRU|nr:replicase [Rubus virus 1]QLI58025.1 replicase [Rubus virus 1]
MSFSYRSPVEEVLNKFTSDEQSRVASEAIIALTKAEKNSFENFSFAMGDLQRERLIQAGIYISPYSCMPHSHPVCKTLENYFLFRVLPRLLSSDFYFVSIKKGKLDLLRKRDNSLNLCEFINRCVTSVDRTRYGAELHAHKSQNIPGVYPRARNGFEGTPELRDLLPLALKQKRRHLFLHDELHYWSQGSLFAFLTHVQPEVMLATVVIPPELLISSTRSLNPWCYTYEVSGNSIFFAPDGILQQAYEQPIDCVFLLKTRRIILPCGDVYCLDIVESKFAHHLISITKGDACVGTVRGFSGFDAVSASSIASLGRNVSDALPIHYSVISKLYRYLRTLKKPDVESAMAKLSQILPCPTGLEIKFCEEFTKLVLQCSTVNTKILPDNFTLIKDWFARLLPRSFSRYFSCVRRVTLDTFIENLQPFNFLIKTIDLHESFPMEIVFISSGDFASEPDHVLSGLDEHWFGREQLTGLEDRVPAPYCSLFKEERYDDAIETAKFLKNEVTEEQFVRVVFRKALRARFNIHVKEQDFIEMVSLATYIMESSRVYKIFKPESLSCALLNLFSGLSTNLDCVKAGARWFYSFILYGPYWFLKRSSRRFNMKFLGHVKPIESFGKLKNSKVIFSSDFQKIIWDQFDVALKELRSGKGSECKISESKTQGVNLEQPIEIGEKSDEQSHSDVEKLCIVPIKTESANLSFGKEVVNGADGCTCECGAMVKTGITSFRPQFGLVEFGDDLGNRVGALFSKNGLGYVYNGGSHSSLGWRGFLDALVSSCGEDPNYYNQCLVQRFRKGGKIGFHADNESIYEKGHRILTVNYCSEASLDFKHGSSVRNIKLYDSFYYVMPEGFQDEHKHQISKVEEGRISFTFRRDSRAGEEVVKEPKVDMNYGRVFECKGKLPIQSIHDIDEAIMKTSNFAKVYLCNCSGPQIRSELEKVQECLKLAIQVEGLMMFDTCAIFNELGTRRAKEVMSEHNGVLVCLYGGAMLKIEGRSGFVIGPEFRTIQSKHIELQSMEESSVMAFCYKPRNDITTGIRVHDSGCDFDEFTEVLFDVSITLSPDHSVDDYRVFSVPADGNCFWHSVGPVIGVDGRILKKACKSLLTDEMRANKALAYQMGDEVWAEREAIAAFCSIYSVELLVFFMREGVPWRFTPKKVSKYAILKNESWHFEPCMPKNGCVIQAIAECLGRREADVVAVLGREEHRVIYEELMAGNGLSAFTLEQCFEIYGINAFVEFSNEQVEMNAEGSKVGHFSLKDEHLKFCKDPKSGSFSPIVHEVNQVKKHAIAILKSAGNLIKVTPSIERAARLADSMEAGTTGVMFSSTMNAKENLLADHSNLKKLERNVIAIIGTFGSGKSRLFKEFISKSLNKYIVFVSPRKALAVSVANELGIGKGQKGKICMARVSTWEVFLGSIRSVKSGATIVIDEIQLYPPGYLDLVMLLLSEGVNVVVAGDPCQSDYDSDSDRHIFAGVEPDIVRVLEGEKYRYNLLSHRFKNPMFKGRLPCRFARGKVDVNEEEYNLWDSIAEFAAQRSKSVEVVLVAGFEEKHIVKVYMPTIECLTYGESTGMTFKHGAVYISEAGRMCSEKRWITALSRFSYCIDFINGSCVDYNGLAQIYNTRALGNFLMKRASESFIFDMLPGEPVFTEGFGTQVGKDFGVKEEKLQGDPWLKTMIFLGQQSDQEIEEMQEAFKNEPWFRTHVPIFPVEAIRARWAHKIMDKYAREFRIGQEISNQFPEDHSKNNGARMTTAADRYEAIYPRHRGTDSVTFLMAVRKRLTFSNPQKESAKFREVRNYGLVFLKEFMKRVPLKRCWDPVKFSEALQDFEDKKTSKSAATIENHSGRSCRDWLSDIAVIFMKSQHCTKFEKRFADAKAGQTLACFHHSVLCRFAPYMRYIEKKLFEALPKNLYIHSGKGLDELNEWTKIFFNGDECTESDYEAFDASQDHYILAFEVAVMKFLNIPGDIVEDYIFIKTRLGSKLGNFSIMRFTGEASTFLFNTMANMLFTFLKYDLNGSEGICFAGDDMCANRRLRERKGFEGLMKKMKLKAKVCFTKNPTFCGWCMSPQGIYKKPQLVLERMMIARETNNLQNCMDNYAIEVSYAYRLGEKIIGRLEEEEAEAHYNCVRFIVKNKHLLRSSVRNLFSCVL